MSLCVSVNNHIKGSWSAKVNWILISRARVDICDMKIMEVNSSVNFLSRIITNISCFNSSSEKKQHIVTIRPDCNKHTSVPELNASSPTSATGVEQPPQRMTGDSLSLLMKINNFCFWASTQTIPQRQQNNDPAPNKQPSFYTRNQYSNKKQIPTASKY